MMKMVVKRRNTPKKIDIPMINKMNRVDQETKASVNEAEALKNHQNQDVPQIDRFVKKKMVTKSGKNPIVMSIRPINEHRNIKKAKIQTI